jgi:hypothetical protein
MQKPMKAIEIVLKVIEESHILLTGTVKSAG